VSQTSSGGIVRNAKRLALLATAASLSLACRQHQNPIAEGELVRRTQQMFDAVPSGDQTSWKANIADGCLYFDEKGRAMDKAALLADLTPMPAGYSGSITLANVKSHIEPTFAILSYDENEKETIYGQNLTARYHETDTWVPRNGDWQIIAGQVLRYYEDPAEGVTNASRFPKYIGTYELAPGQTLTIATEYGQLFRQRGKQPKVQLIPEAGDIFFRKGVEGRMLFRASSGGKIDTLIDRRNNEDVIWKKIK
jgi:hypothetical protein